MHSISSNNFIASVILINHMIHNFFIFFLIFLFINTVGYASTDSYTPRLGSIERNQIISVIKIKFESELTKHVKLRINSFKIQKGWSFLRGVLLDKSGSPFSYQGTPYQDAVNDGIFDDWFCVLLRKEKGQWQVIVHSIGATDVPYLDWAERFNAPDSIFK